MKSITRKKAIYLLLLLVICLAGIGIKGTYAKFAAGGTTEKDIVSLNLSFNIGISNIEEYEEVVVEANDYKIFNVSIKNSSSNTAYYGVWYQMVIPSEKNDKIIIARSMENNTPTTDSIDSSANKTATIIIKNNTSSSIKVNVGVSSSEKSTDSIEYLGGKKLISGTTAEADYYYDEATSKYISTTDSSISFTTDSTTYSYTGSSQTFTPNHDGTYKLEAWGAQGATDSSTYYGGYGAYATGYTGLKKNTSVYVFVGGKGKNINTSSATGSVYGYPNGGSVTVTAIATSNITYSSGGGSSHITLVNQELNKTSKKDILIVAAGGGGSCNFWSKGDNGGSGGGIIGSTTSKNYSDTNPTGGTQSSGGQGGGNLDGHAASSWLNGAFGIGGGTKVTTSSSYISGGGGGGYYGGGASWGGSGAGGSSYIGNSLLINKVMVCYSCQTSEKISTLTKSTENVSATATANYAKKENGEIKITPTVPTVSSPSTIIPNYQLKTSDIICKGNGSGCKVIRVSDTSTMTSGTKNITIIVKDDFGYLYKYVKTITIGTASKLLSSTSVGSYVRYIGNNGCSGAACEGQNANYVSDSDMGYCSEYSKKFSVSGWRIIYIENGIAYLASAGSTECLCTDQYGSSSTTCNGNTSNIQQHLANLNAISLKYCNKLYAYGNTCDNSTVWAINDSDFKKITNKELSKTSCYRTTSDTTCGYGNNLLDVGSWYWFATAYDTSANTSFRWNVTSRHIDYYTTTPYALGVRPIIKLQSTVKAIGGTGTYQDPYIISAE